MAEVDVESLYVRFAALAIEGSDEGRRQLTHDLLTVLVDKQAIVINLQRRAFSLSQAGSPDARLIQSHAEVAFALVQRLNDLRRRVMARRASHDDVADIDPTPIRATRRGVSLRHVSTRQLTGAPSGRALPSRRRAAWSAQDR
jgi:hypothetical protein